MPVTRTSLPGGAVVAVTNRCRASRIHGAPRSDTARSTPGRQTDVNTVIAQARRLTQGSYHAQYQVILSDIFGADGGQPSNTTYPCTSGNCSNWVTFVGDVVSELQATGLPFAYDIWNEPDISVFWPGGAQTSQYYQMWQSAYKEIRSVAPNATIVGPDFASRRRVALRVLNSGDVNHARIWPILATCEGASLRNWIPV